MSYILWRSLFENDVDTFRQTLSTATFSATATRSTSTGQLAGHGLKVGSPGNLATSPRPPPKNRKGSGYTPTSAVLGRNAGPVLTRAELNMKDSFGRTLLHHAASLRSDDALDFVQALLEVPYLDLYSQDLESGWTALHRALYFGNISIAEALMNRDLRDATDYTTSAQHTHAGGLVKIKDHEGNSPFEVFGLTIAPRTLPRESTMLASGIRDDDSNNGIDDDGEHEGQERSRRYVGPSVDLAGDEVYVFGSNKNLSLGVGDNDDRHYPDRLAFERPEHLLRRLWYDHVSEHADLSDSVNSLRSPSDLPAIIRFRPLVIQNVVMSKLHTAVLTSDPMSNLYICGYGPGGRLGTGDENTSFTYRCIQAGGLAKRHISSIALGQDHSVAVCSEGEVYTWGSNRYGQLGYALPETPQDEIPMQLIPRQLFGYIKKELVVGAAASPIHTAIYTSSALFTFGKNEGQLGLMDADARSLEMQILPRRVGVSLLQSGIQSVSAIDRATIVLLENHDVIVFTHYGWTKVLFPLEAFTNYYMPETLSRRNNTEANYVKQICSGGNTICALSSFGEVFNIDVPGVSDSISSTVSTTNPTKARNALPPPSRLWALRKDHMSATDVAVGQDSSIIISTVSGSVWRKERRANIKAVRDNKKNAVRAKDYKFVRIPNLTGVVAVRSNAYGSFAAVRKDATVTRDQIVPDAPSLWTDMLGLLPFLNYGQGDDLNTTPSPSQISRAIISNASAEQDFISLGQRYEPLSESQYDLWLTSTVTDVRIPIHSFLLNGRSRVMRAALLEFQETYYSQVPDILSIEYGKDGQGQVSLKGADFLTLVNLAFYMYTDNVIDVWHYTSKALQSATRYRSVRTELMKIATHLEMRDLERAVRVMVDPDRSLCRDMEVAILDVDFFQDADVLVELAEDAGLPAHSALLCRRCPFFNGLFNGRAGGLWMASRRSTAEDECNAVRVDLKHVTEQTFTLVLRHLYADTGTELFDQIVTATVEELLDIVIDVMSVANELMLDRLAQICQEVVGKYVTMRSISYLVNTVAECTMNSFKRAALEYICLNLEGMMELKLLGDLDPELQLDLDGVVQANQLAFQPFARSSRAEDDLIEAYPGLLDQVEECRKRRVDSMRLSSRLAEDELRRPALTKTKYGSLERTGTSPHGRSPLPTPADVSPLSSPGPSPAIRANDADDDLPFDMDGDLAQAPAATTNTTGLLATPDVRFRRGELQSRSSGRLPDFQLPPAQELHSAESRNGNRLHEGDISDHTGSPSAAGGFASVKAPWQSSSPLGKKDGLRDIMAQASATRVSTLTQAMRSIPLDARSNTKLSQKERKRRQQLAKEETTPTESALSAQSPATTATTSPWQKIARQPEKMSSSTTVSAIEPRKAEPAKQPISTQLPKAQVSSTTSTPMRKASQGPRPALALSTTPSTPVSPQIQSIRHTPLPTRTLELDARTSMSEILAQEQYAKLSIKEAAAKRSLQEIQQEQEFQQWWDTESRRVQNDEARADAAAARRGKRIRGQGGARGGHSRGKAVGPADSGAQQARKSSTIKTPAIPQDTGSARGGRSNPASRGSTRGGRGRSRGQATT